MKIINNKSHKNIIVWSPLILGGLPSKIYKDACLIVENGLITEIRTNITQDDLHTLKEIYAAELIITDCTLMPGMIDCHVHLALNGINFQQAVEQWEHHNEVFGRFENELANYQQRGILTIRDGGDKNSLAHTFNVSASNNFPKIISTGFGLYKTGFYGSFLGRGVSSIKEISPLLDHLTSLGVNQLKVIISGIVSFKEFGKVGPVQWSIDELKEITYISHSKGLKVMAHASSHEGVSLAIQGEVDTIEHGYFLKSDDLELMALHNIPWVPTVIPVAAQTFLQNKDNYTPEEIDVITKTYLLQLDRIKEGFDLGVVIGIGTDAGASGVLHGKSYFEELRLFSEVGISNEDIIKAATYNGAMITGTQEVIGELTIGKYANLIGVQGNPMKDLQALKDVKLIII